jgi:class 3 adenylate cyclase
MSGTMRRLTLHFTDDRLETAFRHHLFRQAIGSVRLAHLLGMAAWVAWGLFLRQYSGEGTPLDFVVWCAAVIPILSIGLLVTWLPAAERVWETEVVVINVLATIVWSVLKTTLPGVPFEVGYVGVIFILAFTFTVNRLRFQPATVAGIAISVAYLVVVVVLGEASGPQLMLAMLSLGSFVVLGMAASYTLERSTRLLFLRERQLDHERERSEGLLLNVLPEAVAARLKDRADAGLHELDGGSAVADTYPEVAVLFADLAGSTEQASRTSADALVACLNDIFWDMDRLADRYGLEKIKTIGDAYMAVAGVPTEVAEPGGRALDMAVDLVSALERRRWPSGDPVGVRVGIAVGPVTAGVIGRRKFAYDVWGDTVNLASRLEASAPSGGVLVPASLADRAADRFVFGPLERLDVKGKGRQEVRLVLGRVGPMLMVDPSV